MGTLNLDKYYYHNYDVHLSLENESCRKATEKTCTAKNRLIPEEEYDTLLLVSRGQLNQIHSASWTWQFQITSFNWLFTVLYYKSFVKEKANSGAFTVNGVFFEEIFSVQTIMPLSRKGLMNNSSSNPHQLMRIYTSHVYNVVNVIKMNIRCLDFGQNTYIHTVLFVG